MPGHGPRFVCLLQHRWMKSAQLVAALCEGARGVWLMELKDLYRDVILDHNRIRVISASSDPRRVGRRTQPVVRRPATPLR